MFTIEEAYDHNHAVAELSYEALNTGVKMTKQIVCQATCVAAGDENDEQSQRTRSIEEVLGELLLNARELIDFNSRPVTRALFLEKPHMDDSLFYKFVLDARKIVKDRGRTIRSLRLSAQRAISAAAMEAKFGSVQLNLMVPEQLMDTALTGILTSSHRQAHIWLGRDFVQNANK